MASAIPDTTVNMDSAPIDNYRDLKAVFTDAEEGSGLTYSIESNTNTGLVTATIIGADSTLDLSFTASTTGTATITIRATDSGTLTVDDVFTVTVTDPLNNPPTVASAIADTTVNEDNPTIDNYRDLKTVFTDVEDGSGLTFTIQSNTNTGLVTPTIIPGDSTLDLSFTAQANGTATITVRATDSGSKTVDDVFTVTVNAVNDAPTVAAAIPDTTVLENNQTIDNYRDLNAVFTDLEDGSALNFIIQNNTNPGLVTPTIIPGDSTLDLSFTASTFGASTITIRATDGGALSVDDVFTVTVNPLTGIAVLTDDCDMGQDTGAIDNVGSIDLFNSDEWGAFCFVNVNVPQGVTITSALFKIYPFDTADDSPDVYIDFEQVDSATALALTTNNISNRWTETGNKVTWQQSNVGTGQVSSPDLSVPLQAIINRPGWKPGNTLMLLLDEIASVDLEITGYGENASKAARLDIQYTVVNNAPTVASAIPDTTVVEDNAPIDNYRDLNAVFTDTEDGGALNFIIQSNTNPGLVTPTIGADSALDLSFTASTSGTATITVRATDGGALTVDDVFTVTVNGTPTVASAIPDTTVAYSSPAIDNYRDLKAVFTDAEDGSGLTYTIQSNTNTGLVTASIIPADSTLDLSFTASTSGTATITIRATDSGGSFVDDVFTVTVNAFSGNKQTGFGWSDDVASFTSKGDDVSLAALTGTTYVLGIQVAMTAGAASANWVLQVREDGAGSWLDVFALGAGDSQVWYTDATHTFSKVNGGVVATAEFGNGTAPTGFTAVDGEFSDDNDGVTDGYTGTDIYTELQYTVRAVGAAAGHTYEFRVLYNALVLDLYDTYATTATVTALPATLLGRYWFNEAPTGQAPATVVDDQASPVNLGVTYDTLAWRLDAGHRGLGVPVAGRINNLQHAGIASATVEGTKYKTTLDDATSVTFVVVAEWEGGWSDRMAGFTRPDGSRVLLLLTNASGVLEFRYDGTLSNPRFSWPGPWDDGVRRVFHLVYDSDDATLNDRVRLYVDGVDQGTPTIISGAMPPNGDGLDFGFTDIQLVALNEPDFTNGFPGSVFYMAVYDGEMTDAEITSDVTALLADDDNNLTYAVDVTLNGVDSLPRLPSNGTSYGYKYTVTNNSSVIDDFDLFGYPGDTLATFLTVDSIIGPNVTGGATADSARITGIPASGVDSAFVWYSVANVAVGTLDSLYLNSRSLSDTTVSDPGWAFIEVVKPNLATGKAVSPNGTQLPGTVLTYTVTITNDGSDDAVGVVVLDALPVEIDFQVSSVVNNLPAGVGVVVEYSDDAGSTWTYTPVSAGCSAPTTFDSCVTHIRWTLQNDLSWVGPDNTGTVQFAARIQ